LLKRTPSIIIALYFQNIARRIFNIASGTQMGKPGGNRKLEPIQKLFVIFFTTFLSLFIGIAISFLILSPIYESSAQVLVQYPGKLIDYTGRETDFLDIQAKLIESRPVTERVAKKLSLPQTPATGLSLLKHVKTHVEKKGNIIVISFDSRYPQEAAEISNAFAYTFKEVSKEIAENSIKANIAYTNELLDSAEKDFKEKETALANAGYKTARLRLERDASEKFFQETYEKLQYLKNVKERFEANVIVFDEARPQRNPIYPNRKKILLFALLIGFITGTAIVYFIDKKSILKTF
jgi:capsular polysaccharide biosynthesis protein